MTINVTRREYDGMTLEQRDKVRANVIGERTPGLSRVVRQLTRLLGKRGSVSAYLDARALRELGPEDLVGSVGTRLRVAANGGKATHILRQVIELGMAEYLADESAPACKHCGGSIDSVPTMRQVPGNWWHRLTGMVECPGGETWAEE